MTRGLDYQPYHYKFLAGLGQKSDPRAQPEPMLDVCKDAQFDETGGLQTRKPYVALSNNILGGGTLSNCRRLVPYGDELLCFTKDTLYSWNAQLSKWVSKATHLAVAIDETTRFAGRSDQIDCDRAELDSTVVFAWREKVDSGGTTVDVGYAAAIDKITGSVVVAPTRITGQASRTRLVALSTKILLFVIGSTGDLTARAFTPSTATWSPSLGSPGTAVLTAAGDAMNSYYDVERIPGSDTAIVAARISPTTSYTLAKVTSALAVSKSTKARTCDGPIAVACIPVGGGQEGNLFVLRANGTSIRSDEIVISTLADAGGGVDIVVGAATGTPVNQITGAVPLASFSGEDRCYVFWSAEESTSASTQQTDGFGTEMNWVDTAANIGTEASFVAGLGVGSRAFQHDGRVYVNLAFEGNSILNVVAGSAYSPVQSKLQNTYFLYRDDAELVGKATPIVGGGYSASIGHLPGVQSLGSNKYAWCATERRRVVIAASGVAGFAARAPHDTVIEFDTNRSRRAVQHGESLYLTGAEVKLFDGTSLVEAGFHTFIWHYGATQGVSAAGLANGTYFWTGSYRWDSAKGERDRSPLIVTAGVTVAGGPDKVGIGTITPVRPTHKTGIAVELWRTPANPADGTPFYLVTSPDPSIRTNPNMYLQNPATTDTAFVAAFDDEMVDADLQTKENSPANGDVLESLAPPGATLVVGNDTRVFLAGVANDRHRVWYSKQRSAGEIAAFHDNLTIPVPQPGGDITALGLINERLVVFRETSIYEFGGEGFDNIGGGYNYGPPRTVSTDLGAVGPDAVALTPLGLVFKSLKGWYVYDGAGLRYIGAGVVDYDSETPLAIHVVEAQHQVRVLYAARMLVLDYLNNMQWAEWTIADGVHAAIWNGTYHYLTATGPKAEQANYSSGVDYGMDVETGWIKPFDLLGQFKWRWVEIIGEWRSSFHLRVRVARDYDSDGAGSWNWFDDYYHAPLGAFESAGDPFDLRHQPSITTAKAIKFRFGAVSSSNHANKPTGEAMKLTGLVLEVAPRSPTAKRLGVGTAPSSS